MTRKAINTENAPEAVGPYSQAYRAGDWIFTSGQIPLTPEGSLVEGGIERQTHQVFQNVQAILEAEGASFNDVVKVTVFLTDMTVFSTVNEIYAQYFNGHQPARSCIEVSQLPKKVDIKMEVTATLS